MKEKREGRKEKVKNLYEGKKERKEGETKEGMKEMRGRKNGEKKIM